MMRALSLLILLLTVTASAQEPGSCAVGSATGTLDQSGVRASFPITGTLFFGQGLRADYTVPQDLNVSPVFAASVWIGGTVDGELRVAASNYGQGGSNNDYFEFWPGPLDDGATLPDPTDCSAFDRIWVVSQSDIADYEAGRAPSADLAEWPVGLGASAVTAAGAPVVPASRDQTLDLAAGERPVVLGTQAAFWVMNDVGNVHRTTGSNPLGIEVAVTAFSVASTTPAFHESTFYRYRITNRNSVDIEEMRVGFWADTDLGNSRDDFVGVDTTRSLGYTYNADEVDDGAYGSPPPAFGVDILGGAAEQTPHATAFVFFFNSSTTIGDARDRRELDRLMRGVWRDGTPITEFGNGYNQGGDVTTFVFSGDPVTQSFWSEEDNGTGRNVAGDRRFLLSSELGRLASGAAATIDYALVFARGADRLDSITELRAASDAIQAEYDAGALFAPAPPVTGAPPVAPTLLSPTEGGAPLAGPVELAWTASPEAIDYLVEVSDTPDFADADRLIADGTSTVYEYGTESEFQDAELTLYWRVTARRGALASRSGVRSYPYFLPAVLPEVYIVEVIGPGGSDPCGPDATSTVGCPSSGSTLAPLTPGNVVYQSLNGTGAYQMASLGPTGMGSISIIGNYSPHDFEIRIVPEDQGSYAYYSFDTNRITRVPFQIWDLGVATPGDDDDPSDDVRMVPILFSDNGTEPADQCTFGFFGPEPFGEGTGRATQRIYAYYPVDDNYSAYEVRASAAVAADPDECAIDMQSNGAGDLIDFGRGRPLQRDVFVQAGSTTSVADLEGTVVRYYTRDGSTPTEPEPVSAAGFQIEVSPNPARGRTQLTVRLDRPGAVRIDVVDALGRRVARLADAPWSAGERSVAVGGLAPGVYLAVVTLDGTRQAIPFTVIR